MADASTRPPIVGTAILLLWASLGLGIPLVALRWSILTQIAPVAMLLAFSVAFGGFAAWLIVKTARGRNWARWLNLAIFALGLADYLCRIGEISAHNPIPTAIEIAQYVAQLVAFILLFLPEASAWFRPPKTA